MNEISMKHENINQQGPLDRVSTKPPVESDQQMVEKLLERGDRMLQVVRKQILDADMQYRVAATAVVERAEDELARLKASHVKRMTALRTTLRKIEAIRDA